MRIYVAGPMTGIHEWNFPRFHAETARLRALGHVVIKPAEINPDTTLGWEMCMRADIQQLVTCEAICLLPGFENSKGARLERHIAMELGMQVMYAPEAS
ncbi:DUF4406 domain-containing protein [Paraburkholderia caballeronis]|uniref:Nucleoside 2-deoxyribosyltransferase n=1 Tax=Paraburkholderia caballeronis TaxID=416943 RepID=A0A1H7KZS6_9BURK|nr:DUF4406 domain-containing protein [Paraburkholderia caballeronis]PXW28235.1 uncharacterized protein DUF4406 [Paraburkholderia caballeronis]PXX03601.1 uncharacterized protein DUF4406 [Paraburkholderia caballeronis]RAK04345.1 uncharacterized protein DUF4406 [Paraburkholderia caballeronis]SED83966.1 protein of unknown function [Paraburkholderia caballeronis]SEK92299.1 protein of unknown function [Paraburkholderia caballeronis]